MPTRPTATICTAMGNAKVLALDVGTTNLECCIYDEKAKLIAFSTKSIQILRPEPGWVEINEEVLWQDVVNIIKKTITSAKITAADILCMGISTMRNSFILWDTETGESIHKMIVWQDLRASDLVEEWNKSATLKALNAACKVLYWLTRSSRFLGGSVYNFRNGQLAIALLYSIKNTPGLLDKVKKGQVRMGTVDTYLLWKLTNGSVYCTEYSIASATAIFDPYLMQWSSLFAKMVGIPMNILPPIKDTCGLFGHCDFSLFGAAIPITAVVSDQSASMFGQCCFKPGDVKCTMGTGTFMDLNTSTKPHASIAGLYPIVGWKIGDDCTFIAEGSCNDTGKCADWLERIGLIKNVSESSEIAQSVPDTDGTYFIPAFGGLQAPIVNDHACACFIALKLTTKREHMVRAVLESLAFRCYHIYLTMLKESHTDPPECCRVDGGVTKNDFLVQMICDLMGVKVRRSSEKNMSALGAAYLAGLGAGLWKDKAELETLQGSTTIFEPQKNVNYEKQFSEWQRATKRSFDWYNHVSK